jgi:hypothetical protein
MAESTGGKPRLPEELILLEILTRLPSKPLLRCRAVCRSWRRCLTSHATFLLAHHSRQPELQLVSTGDARESRIDALDHRAGERRPIVQTDRATTPEDLALLAAYDGLLIVSAYRALHICNPATHQPYNGFETADLWVLEDYEDNLWTVKFRIQLQRPVLFVVPDAQGNVFVTCVKKGSMGIESQCLKHLSCTDGRVLSRHQWNVHLNLKRHRFKESLVQHDFFMAQCSSGVDERPLFNGLSTVAVLPDDDC